MLGPQATWFITKGEMGRASPATLDLNREGGGVTLQLHGGIMASDRPGRGYRKNVGAEPSQENSGGEMAKKAFESLSLDDPC